MMGNLLLRRWTNLWKWHEGLKEKEIREMGKKADMLFPGMRERVGHCKKYKDAGVLKKVHNLYSVNTCRQF